jgi:hypothetical protein
LHGIVSQAGGSDGKRGNQNHGDRNGHRQCGPTPTIAEQLVQMGKSRPGDGHQDHGPEQGGQKGAQYRQAAKNQQQQDGNAQISIRA